MNQRLMTMLSNSGYLSRVDPEYNKLGTCTSEVARTATTRSGCTHLMANRDQQLRNEIMAEADCLESLFLQSLAAHARPATASPMAKSVVFPGCWIPCLPLDLEAVAERLIRDHRELGDLLRIRAHIIAGCPRLQESDSAFELESRRPGFPGLGAFVVHQSLSSDLVLAHFGDAVAGPESGSAYWLLLEFLWPLIHPMYQAGLKYYGIDESGAGTTETRQALFVAVFVAISACSMPSTVLASPDQAIPAVYLHLLLKTIREQFLMMLGLLGFVMERPSGFADVGPELAAIEDDREFAEAFHAEWERALQFEDGFYGFHVVVNTGWIDIERYLRLAYSDGGTAVQVSGYRREISWEACNYLIHQARVPANLIRILDPEQVASEYEKAVAEVFDPLISSVAYRVGHARWIGEKEALLNQFIATARTEAQDRFSKAYRKFKFHYMLSDEDPLYRPYGLLRQSGEPRYRVPPLFAVATDDPSPRTAKEISFPRYVERVLNRWAATEIQRSRPAADITVHDAETLDHIREFRPENTEGFSKEARVEAPDGTMYVLIDKLAKHLGCAQHQLRRFDKQLDVRRAHEVFGDDLPRIGRQKLKRDARLYKADEDLIHRASRLVGKIGHATTKCETQGITRAELCRLYDLSRHTVLYWEQKDLVQPITEHGHVIYPPDQVKQALRLAHKTELLDS